jgi:hypothetical protein
MEGKERRSGIGVIYRQVNKRGRDEVGKAGKIERLEGCNSCGREEGIGRRWKR